MKHAVAATLALLWCGFASAANFATCILEKMPSAKNDQAAYAVVRVCQQNGTFQDVAKGSGRGWFGYKSADQCILAKAQDIQLPRAALLTSNACRCLYSEPQYQGEVCFPKAGQAPPCQIDWDKGVMSAPPASP